MAIPPAISMLNRSIVRVCPALISPTASIQRTKGRRRLAISSISASYCAFNPLIWEAIISLFMAHLLVLVHEVGKVQHTNLVSTHRVNGNIRVAISVSVLITFIHEIALPDLDLLGICLSDTHTFHFLELLGDVRDEVGQLQLTDIDMPHIVELTIGVAITVSPDGEPIQEISSTNPNLVGVGFSLTDTAHRSVDLELQGVQILAHGSQCIPMFHFKILLLLDVVDNDISSFLLRGVFLLVEKAGLLGLFLDKRISPGSLLGNVGVLIYDFDIASLDRRDEITKFAVLMPKDTGFGTVGSQRKLILPVALFTIPILIFVDDEQSLSIGERKEADSERAHDVTNTSIHDKAQSFTMLHQSSPEAVPKAVVVFVADHSLGVFDDFGIGHSLIVVDVDLLAVVGEVDTAIVLVNAALFVASAYIAAWKNFGNLDKLTSVVVFHKFFRPVEKGDFFTISQFVVSVHTFLLSIFYTFNLHPVIGIFLGVEIRAQGDNPNN